MISALKTTGLEALVVGSTAAILQGAPLMTQDIDLLVRDTERNREKLATLCSALGGSAVEITPLSTTKRIVGLAVGVDILFDEISGGLAFASLRSRAVEVEIGPAVAVVASLEDVIASKRAADRPKDRAQLPILEDTLRVKRALDQPK